MSSTTMVMDRTGMGMPGVGMPGMGGSPMGAAAGMPMGPNYLMVPRCTLQVEKCQGGMKVNVVCEDAMACSMVQNLCTMLAGGMMGCSVMCNGMTVCTCSLAMGMCKCEMTAKGVCLTCTSGDAECCKMIQACCDCLSTMLKAGCCCFVTMNNTPVCCGCESSSAPAKTR